MPFQIIRQDITKVKADAIVNTANRKPIYGSGIDKAVYTAAGVDRLLAERQKIGVICPGEVACTPAFDLPAKYIFHAVGPFWQGGEYGEFAILKSCYDKSLALAKEMGLSSIAFPLLATGNNGFPKDQALQIALNSISAFCLTNDMEVTLVVFSDSALELSGKVFTKIEEFLSSEEAREIQAKEYFNGDDRRRRRYLQDPQYIYREEATSAVSIDASESRPHAKKSAAFDRIDPEEYVKKTESLFCYRLNELIEDSGEKASVIYNRAGVSKQVFSKIMTSTKYLPTKNTVLALSMALHLDMKETRDLLSRAGHALSPADKGDRLVEAYILNGEYDLFELSVHYLKYTGKSFTSLLDPDDEEDILKGKLK